MTLQNIPPCFQDVISLIGCANQNPSSGLFIDDTGITIDELNQLSGKEFFNGEGLFYSKYGLAINEISNKIHTRVSSSYKTNTVLSGRRIGVLDPLLKVIVGTNKFRGIEIGLCNTDSFLDIFISTVDFTLSHTGDVTAYVYDSIEGKLLDTLTFTTVAGETLTVPINKTYTSKRKQLKIAILIDASLYEAYKITVGTGCITCGSGLYDNGIVQASGVAFDDADSVNHFGRERTGNTYGMSLNYSVNCNHKEWLCTINNVLAMAILWKTAANIMEYGIHSSVNQRSNTTVTINSDTLKDRMVMYGLRSDEAIDDILKYIKLPKDSRCFECSQPIKHAIVLP